MPPHIALHCLLSISSSPEIFTEVSPTLPAKNPSMPYVNSFGFFTFILIVKFGESSFLKDEYGLFPVIALASALNALSLFVFRLSYEFAWIAALLSANATCVPSFGMSKISYGIHENEGVTPIISYEFLMESCFEIKFSSKL